MASRGQRATGRGRRLDDRGDRCVDLVFGASFLSLATSDADGVPWCSPLEYVCDEALNLYWVSKIDARHSENVRLNPRAAIAIFDSGQTPGVGLLEGLYAEGRIAELDATETTRLTPTVRRWLAWRDAERLEPRPPHSSGDGAEWRFYRFSPSTWYWLEPVADPRAGSSDERVRVDFGDRFSRRYHRQS